MEKESSAVASQSLGLFRRAALQSRIDALTTRAVSHASPDSMSESARRTMLRGESASLAERQRD